MTRARHLAWLISDCAMCRNQLFSSWPHRSRPMVPAVSSVRRFGQPAPQTHPHLISDGEVTPGITKEEYKGRRTMLISLALQNTRGMTSVNSHMFVFPSATKVYMTNDIPYPFRQNSDFLYLCGFLEPDSILVIHSKTHEESSLDNHKSVLFVPKKDPRKELWEGPRSGREGAVTLTGVDEAFNFQDFEHYLSEYCKGNQGFMLWYDYIHPIQTKLHNSVMSPFICQEWHSFVDNASQLVHHLRVRKSLAEIELMRQSAEIASEALVQVMKFSRPQVNEAHLWAKMDFECRVHGAQRLAYPPVIAGGSRANTIHYIANDQVIADGDLVLMDAGCELHGYASDITRTWPVNGRFSPAQRELYEAVLSVQKACITFCTTRHSLDDVYKQMLLLLGMELQKLDIIPHMASPTDIIKRSRELCPHHVGHYLGMDVHDTGDYPRSQKMQPGMVVTVEPGLYIRSDDTTVPEKYRGIGIRIEDNILITDSDPVNLSQKCPKTVEEIERIMSQR